MSPAFKYLVAVVLLIAVMCLALSAAHDKELNVMDRYLVRNTREKVYLYDIRTGEEKEAYQQRFGILHYNSASISPDSRYIGVIDYGGGENFVQYQLKSQNYDTMPPIHLILLNIDPGELAYDFDKVLSYDWSPDGRYIAYTTYDLKDLDLYYRFPTGLWVYDFTTGDTIKVAEAARMIKWAKHDNCLYYYDNRLQPVYCWNPEDKTTRVTEYHDIYFSSDGKYYVRRADETYSHTTIYSTETNTQVCHVNIYARDTTGLEIGALCIPIKANIYELDMAFSNGGWIYDSDHLLHLAKDEIKSTGEKVLRNIFYDPEAGEIRSEMESEKTDWVAGNYRAVTKIGGQLKILSAQDVSETDNK